MSATHVLVVSLRKSGTHLLKEVMSGFGYPLTGAVSASGAEPRPLGREAALRVLSAVYTKAEVATLARCQDRPLVDRAIHHAVMALNGAWSLRLGMPAAGFPPSDGATEQLLHRTLSRRYDKRFSDTPSGVCWFAHDLDLERIDESFLFEWMETGNPKIIFNYRDPRDVLLSMVNFLSIKDSGNLGQFADHHIYGTILKELPDVGERLTLALTDPCFPGGAAFERALWLLRHPNICKVSFEELVGPRGGGTARAQVAAIEKIAGFVGSGVAADTLAAKVFNPDSHTFHAGRIGGWREHFSEEHQRLFNERYGHILQAYGYS